MDSVPLVCITGQVRSALIGTDAFQETDVFGVTLSLTKWSRLVRTIDEIPEAIAEGFYWARSGRPGPVVIDIPTDLLKAKKEFSGPVKFTPHARPADAKAEADSPTRSWLCCSSLRSRSRWSARERSCRARSRSCGACSTI